MYFKHITFQYKLLTENFTTQKCSISQKLNCIVPCLPSVVPAYGPTLSQTVVSPPSTSLTQSTPTANVIEPEPDEDFLPKEIPDKMDITTLPEKKATVDRWKQGELDQ